MRKIEKWSKQAQRAQQQQQRVRDLNHLEGDNTRRTVAGHAGSQLNLGLVYNQGRGVARDVDRAIELYTQAVEGGYAAAYNNLVILLKSERQDMDGAEKAYRAAIEANPRYASAHFNLGLLLQYKRQDVNGAEKAYRAAIEADPGYADAHCNLGCLLEEERQDFGGAEKAYRKAIELSGGSPIADIHYNLADLLEKKLKDFEGAETAYHAALDANPDDAGAREGLARVQVALAARSCGGASGGAGKGKAQRTGKKGRGRK